MSKQWTIDQLKTLVEAVLGGKWFDQGDYNLNLIGIRNDLEEAGIVPDPEDPTLDLDDGTFNDWFVVAWKEGGQWYTLICKGTTDPGYYWRRDPHRGPDGGVGAIVEGQYRGVYKPGLHRGDKPALVQVGTFDVYRDNDRDDTLTLAPSTIEKGWGFNFHRRRGTSLNVDRWSGGCQVPYLEKDLEVILELVERQRQAGHGAKVTYSLGRLSWLTDPELGREQIKRIREGIR